MTTTISKNLINDEFVLNTGDTMTGILTINSTDPLIIFQPVTGGSNIVFRDDTQSGFNRATINSGASGGLNITLNDGVGVLQTQLTFTTDGNVTVSGATPNAVDNLTRKDYVDDNFVALSGDTMTGNLTVQKSSATITSESNVTATQSTFRAVNSIDDVGFEMNILAIGAIALQRVDGSGTFIEDVFTTGTSDQQVTFSDVPRSNTVPTTINDLTRKDYVDTKFSNRNVIINGNFDVWQRGTSQTTSAYASNDRWKNTNVGSTKVVTRETFAVGQTDVLNNPKYYARTVCTSVADAGNYVIQSQKIEGVHTFAGETVIVSFWAKADASKNIASEFTQNFGSGGSPSAAVVGIVPTTYSLTTTWQRFSATIPIPSISGKTLGTSDDDNLQFIFWFEAGSTYDARTNSLGQQSGTFDIAQIQIEKGSVATDFERRSYSEELALCQRYYWRGRVAGDGSGYNYSAASLTLLVAGVVSFPTTMRATPSVSIVTAPTYTGCTHNDLVPKSDGFSHRVDKDGSAGKYRASAGLFDADAEL